MTTKVTVEAHCANDTEVAVKYASDNGGFVENLQDGQTKEYHVYDDREITVSEHKKV